MLQFLYNFVNSQYFGILLIIWIVIDLIWVSRWRALLGRIGKMITKPSIFSKDKEPNVPPLYPRELLEQLAQYNRDGSKTNGQNEQVGPMTRFANKQREVVFDEENPTRTFGHLLFFVFFIFFLLADTISVASTLAVMQLISIADLPPIFQRFDLAVLGGALLSAVIGIWILVEMSGEDSDLIKINRSPSQRAIIKFIALAVTIFAVIVMVGFAWDRLIAIGDLESNPTVGIILSAILYGLVPINSALSAAISFPEAILGFIVILFILAIIFPLMVFLFDILYRLVYIGFDTSIWALFTPIIAIPFGIGYLAGKINPPSPKFPKKTESEKSTLGTPTKEKSLKDK